MLYKFAEVGNLVCGDSCLRQLSEMLARDGPNKASSSTSLVPSPVVQRKSSIVDWVSIRPRSSYSRREAALGMYLLPS
jgi:hypothetical protein